MSYRCGLCGDHVPPNQPRRTHIIYREAPVADAYRSLPRSRWGRIRMEIAREIPACQQCLTAISQGVDLHELISEGRRLKAIEGQKRQGKLLRSVNSQRSNGYVTPMSQRRGSYSNGSPPVTNGHNGLRDDKGSNDTPKCDVCGLDASEGQVTADTVLCPFHCKKAAGK